jgi:hypothetical protein
MRPGQSSDSRDQAVRYRNDRLNTAAEQIAKGSPFAAKG